MDWIAFAVTFSGGFALGMLAAFFLRIIQSKTAKELAEDLFRENEAKRKESIESMLADMKASFGDLSLEALSRCTGQFLKMANARLEAEKEAGIRELEAKKGLIDRQLEEMTKELEKVSGLVKELESDRIQKFGELTSYLKSAKEQTAALTKTTSDLKEALSSTKARGQWGERMAEDVLKLAGFIENVNYVKQKAVSGSGSRPDFTFLLPQNLKLHMDVKFPFDNYLRYLEASSELEGSRFKNDFLRDVRARINEVTTRDYINPEDNTLDYVLLFIPNERIYGFIHEQDSTILDQGIRKRVVLCSPLTLVAVLAVIRQAVDSFALEKTSNEILSLLGSFKKQYEAFLKKLETVGRRIEDAQKEYETLMSTRRRQLERPLKKIEELRGQDPFMDRSEPEGSDLSNEAGSGSP